MSHPKTTHKAVQLLSGNAPEGPAAEHRRRIAELAVAMDTSHTFHKGQFVKWKAGLKNRATPAYNEPVVVREFIAPPVYDTSEAARNAGSPYFGEPLTLVLGILYPDGDFLEFYCDGRRFEPVD